MFENVRKCLDELENTVKKIHYTEEDENIMKYFNLHLAEALMKDYPESERVARIILAEKGLFEKIGFRFER